MAVIQISKIQHRRGTSGELPDALADGEIGVTTDTGEVFMGAPNLPAIQNRRSYPYQNIKVLTEFDVQRGIKGDVYHNGPLLSVRVPYASSGSFRSVLPLFPNGSIDFLNFDFSLYANNGIMKMMGTITAAVHPTTADMSSIKVTEMANLGWSFEAGSLQSRFKLTRRDPEGNDTGTTWLAFNSDLGPDFVLCVSGREWRSPSL